MKVPRSSREASAVHQPVQIPGYSRHPKLGGPTAMAVKGGINSPDSEARIFSVITADKLIRRGRFSVALRWLRHGQHHDPEAKFLERLAWVTSKAALFVHWQPCFDEKGVLIQTEIPAMDPRAWHGPN